MAWRPLEAASLLAKWARRRWARFLVANIKLPMKKKAEYLFRVRDILADGGWENLRARQLYHDRDEVTFAGVRV
jgi:23S rRNA (cytidine2498-2'-O)-methyltransferase